MSSDAGRDDQLIERTKESFKKARDLVNELKIVEEHEKAILGDGATPPPGDEPPGT
jgi:hypothetical protein